VIKPLAQSFKLLGDFPPLQIKRLGGVFLNTLAKANLSFGTVSFQIPGHFTSYQ
jgi:hypothetical protein